MSFKPMTWDAAMSNMMRFIYRLMGRGVENSDRFYRKH